MVGNLRDFKGIVFTSHHLYFCHPGPGYHHFLLDYCNIHLTPLASGLVFCSLISAQLLLCAHCAAAPTLLRGHAELLPGIYEGCTGPPHLWLHPLLWAHVFSPLHRAAIPAVPQTHQTCPCLRELPGPLLPPNSLELIPSPPLGLCSNVPLLVTSSVSTLVLPVSLTLIGFSLPYHHLT